MVCCELELYFGKTNQDGRSKAVNCGIASTSRVGSTGYTRGTRKNPIFVEGIPRRPSTYGEVHASGKHEYSDVSLIVRLQLCAYTRIQVRITRLHRIQNRWLWERYVQHKERLARKNGDDYVNEMCLFHGTRETPQKIYFSEEGFDMRYSCGGSWGIGNYFAVNASYSDRVFSYVCKTADVKQLLMAKVLTGHSFASEVDKSLRKPPIMKDRRCQISGIEDPRYDTVTGVTRGCRVYITYSNDKAYPCYLITYKNRR